MKKRLGMEGLGCEQRYDFAFDATGTDTEQMTPQYDLVFGDTTLGNGTLFLPPVAEMAGRTISIFQVGANALTIKPFQASDATPSAKPDSGILAAGGAGASTSMALVSAGAFAVLYCTGHVWVALAYDLNLGA